MASTVCRVKIIKDSLFLWLLGMISFLFRLPLSELYGLGFAGLSRLG